MTDLTFAITNLAVALGIGLLIGGERERRKGSGTLRSAAGIRTFTLASLAGAVSMLAGREILLAVTIIGTIVLTALAYWRTNEDDPGLTTEIALILTVLLGGLSVNDPVLAAGIAVAAVVLLASRTILHHFVRSVLTEDEVRDAIVFASATLVVLPILPNRPMGPFGALNPYTIWVIVILVMAISAAGYIAVRLLGAKFGLPLAGLASGFVSSTATIGAMGERASKTPTVLAAAVAGAVLSTVATVVQLAAVLGTASMETLRAMTPSLFCSGLAAAGYGAVFTFLALREKGQDAPHQGRAFNFSTALFFAGILSCIMLASAALREWFGEAGVIAAAAIAGLADVHAAAISVASLVATGKISAADAVIPILVGISTNTVSKTLFARANGGSVFFLRVVPGLILVALAAWAGTFL